ncbi:PaaD-like zinc ribbon domain-containing protein [Chitinolyticbacter albus]|uniref:PaaD-like zinc ribbon domain-containing protein n=1 Tax=Chitinolyticbacter albus TaxID=2961951 RepID=UPI00210DC4E2|nr:hypothetical protein [Chitinolyticbacter albus]
MSTAMMLAIVILLPLLLFGWQFRSVRAGWWHRFPTQAEYLTRYPDIAASARAHCVHCGSAEILDTGVFGPTSTWRLHCCERCKNPLWRSTSP